MQFAGIEITHSSKFPDVSRICFLLGYWLTDVLLCRPCRFPWNFYMSDLRIICTGNLLFRAIRIGHVPFHIGLPGTYPDLPDEYISERNRVVSRHHQFKG